MKKQSSAQSLVFKLEEINNHCEHIIKKVNSRKNLKELMLKNHNENKINVSKFGENQISKTNEA